MSLLKPSDKTHESWIFNSMIYMINFCPYYFILLPAIHIPAFCILQLLSNPQNFLKKVLDFKVYLNIVADSTSVVQIDKKSDSHSQNKTEEYFTLLQKALNHFTKINTTEDTVPSFWFYLSSLPHSPESIILNSLLSCILTNRTTL